MPRELTPKQATARLAKWAGAGFNIALVDSLTSALEADRKESAGRAPRRTGALASTILVAKASASRAAKTGTLKASLIAGRRSADRRKAVPYAGVLQTGRVYGGPGGRTRPHVIVARKGHYSAGGRFATTGVLSFTIGGRRVFARTIHHPGSRFRPLGYLRVNEPRLRRQLDEGIERSAQKEIG
jgi:hypothetical protein